MHIVLDFDGTITQEDTLHLVAQAGSQCHVGRAESRAPVTPWEDMVQAYMMDYTTHIEKYRPEKSARKTLSAEIAWLNSLEKIEKQSAARVLAGGYFKDVSIQDMKEAAEVALRTGKMRLRSGLVELLTSTSVHDRSATTTTSLAATHSPALARVQVLSVNWSRSFIQSALQCAVRDVASSCAIAVFANEVPPILVGQGSNGTLPPHAVEFDEEVEACELRTSGDKVQQLRKVRRELEMNSGPDSTQVPMIYVGDSATDLECLLEADIGICVQDESMSSGQRDLAEICSRVGVSVSHIGKIVSQSSSTTHPALWWARDFHEITRALAQFAR